MKKIVAIFLVLVMALSFTACGEKLPSSQEIIDRATEAMDDMKTCQMDMDMSLDVAGEAEGEAVDATIGIDASGALDIENRQMQMDMTMNAVVTGEDDLDMNMEMYLVENTFYIMTDVPLMGPTWMKLEMPEEMPEEYWEPTDLMEIQAEFLEAVEVEVTGREKVDGVDCYVLEATADIEQLWQLIMQQIEATGMEIDDIPEEFEGLLDEIFQSYSVKIWIAKDTYFLTKVEIDLAIELTPEAMGIMDEEGEMAIDMALTLLAYDHNQPVSIELPPEAENAVEMPLDF
jgi:predicted small lipoprotein YifL